MLEFVILVLAIALIFYVVFAGADFGAGIYELLCLIGKRRSRKELIEKAIGPIWEANHIWIIIVVVIFFMGFPTSFSHFSNHLHIPMAMILVGITLRGTAFAFRHYDPVIDHWQKRYSWLFGISSVWTAFWQGVVVGSLFGVFPATPSNFYEAYIAPWFGFFNLSVGLFICAIYLFLAHTFFLGEDTTDESLKRSIKRDLWKSVLFVIISGGLVFLTSFFLRPIFIERIVGNKLSISAVLMTTLLLFPLFWSYKKSYTNISRVIVGIQVALIFGAVFISSFPVLLTFDNGTQITYFTETAPEPTIRQLFYALIVGVSIVLPFLVALYRVFKRERLV
jgi:cytochrome bd ubiquinol oxidase subunit II